MSLLFPAFAFRKNGIIFTRSLFHETSITKTHVCRGAEVTTFAIGWLLLQPIMSIGTTDLQYVLGMVVLHII